MNEHPEGEDVPGGEGSGAEGGPDGSPDEGEGGGAEGTTPDE